VLPLLLVAASVGLSNLAAAIGIGFGGVTARTRVRVALTFGVFEAGMPIVGLVVGAGFASSIGHASRWIGAAVLIGIGLVTVVQAWRQPPTANRDPAERGASDPGLTDRRAAEPGAADRAAERGAAERGAADRAAHPGPPHQTDSLGRLIISALALSLDNLAAGFALGTMHVGVAEGAIVIGVVSVVLSLAGLELGGRIGAAAGRRGEQIGGAILVAVGVALAAGVL
jgi:putative Mn2+ efflux pump MntP